jgi:hypothetical protein
MIGIGTNVEWVGTVGASPLLWVKRKLAYAPRQRGFSSVLDPKLPLVARSPTNIDDRPDRSTG